MKSAKKLIILVLVVALGLGLTSCLKNGNADDGNLPGTSSSATDSNSGSTADDAESTPDEGTNDNRENDEQENNVNGGQVDNSSAALRDPSEVSEPANAPPKGEDRTIKGIPEPIDIRVEDDGNLLVLVNKYHAVSSDYRPSGMVSVDPKLGTWNDMELKEEAYEAYLDMNKAAKKTGYNLKICSAYRSYDTQVYLFNNSLSSYGGEKTYLRSAYPGRSEHHTGLAIDITSASMGWGLTQDFADYADGKWLNENCHKYGYILRYPKDSTDITGYMYEPWHFRYVGKETAEEIMSSGITLEEYLDLAGAE